MKPKTTTALAIALSIVFSSLFADVSEAVSDSGRIFASPPVIEDTWQAVPIRDTSRAGYDYQVFHADGVFITDNKESPFYEASYYSQGTLILDKVGDAVGESTFVEATGPDGDTVWWYTLHFYEEGPADFYFIAGTGKWFGIVGGGTLVRNPQPLRTDGKPTYAWDLEWEISDNPIQQVSGPPVRDSYPNHTVGFSFHGPHVTEAKRWPGGKDNYLFTSNYQDEAQIVTDPEDPWYLGYGFHQGTGVRDADNPDGVLMDAGIVSVLHPDGDIFFYAVVAWYATGEVSARLIGGTGKYRNIDGFGNVAPTLVGGGPRVDRTFILNWEFHWSLD